MHIYSSDPLAGSGLERIARESQKEGGSQELKQEQLREACQEFESLFWHQVLRQMRETVPENDLMHGGFAEDVFSDMLDEEYGEVMARQSGPGSLSQMLFEQLGGPELKDAGEDGEAPASGEPPGAGGE